MSSWSNTGSVATQSIYTNGSAPFTIAAGSSYTSAIFPVSSYSSYDLSVIAWCQGQTTGGAPLVLQVTVEWFADVAGEFLLYSEMWWPWLGNSLLTSQIVVGTGPMHGAYMQVTLSNVGSAGTVNINQFNLWGSGRDIAYSDWRQNVPGMNMGDSEQTGNSYTNDNLLCNLQALDVPNSMTVVIPFPLYAGAVWLRYQASAALQSNFVVAAANALLHGSVEDGTLTQGCIWNPADPDSGSQTAGHEYTTTLMAPRAPLYAVINTTSSASSNISLVASAQQGI